MFNVSAIRHGTNQVDRRVHIKFFFRVSEEILATSASILSLKSESQLERKKDLTHFTLMKVLSTKDINAPSYDRFKISDDSDEVHFWLNGYVNKQNCRIWSEANPQVYVETPLHPEKLTVWCALRAGGILLQKR
ncbi:hypothetical protein TNCV_4254511 [Trichonephila clavipes]|nr:hypothetical protein TNCV_4254511 [Trichonephila clavipes]